MSPEPIRVTAVVPTYNRRDLLRECLDAVAAQTFPVDDVLVLDNASTDGTSVMLQDDYPDVAVVRLSENEGAGGGLVRGLAGASTGSASHFWIMDDDTIPARDALERLVDAVYDLAPERPALMVSRALWTDGRLHPENKPVPRADRKHRALAAIERGLVEIRYASWVSVLLDRKALERRGPPISSYFIWGEEIEFTARLLRYETGYWVPNSVVLHKSATAVSGALSSSERYYYDVRNKLWILKSRALAPVEKPWFALALVRGIRTHLRFNRWSRQSLSVVSRGLRDGLRSPP